MHSASSISTELKIVHDPNLYHDSMTLAVFSMPVPLSLHPLSTITQLSPHRKCMGSWRSPMVWRASPGCVLEGRSFRTSSWPRRRPAPGARRWACTSRSLLASFCQTCCAGAQMSD